MPDFWGHVVDATLPVLKICLLGAVGAALSRTGILDQQGRRVLSKLIYCLFTPALTFTKLAPVLSGPHLLLWLPLVINMYVSVGVGLVLGVVLVLVVKPPAGLRKHVVVAAALGNAGNLPLVLVAALIRETGGELFAGEVMSEDLAIAYVAMGIWAATLTHFTLGSELLKLPPAEQQQQQQQQQQEAAAAVAAGGAAGAAIRSKLVEDSSSGMHCLHASDKGSSEGGTPACIVELGSLRPAAQQQVWQQQQWQQQPADGWPQAHSQLTPQREDSSSSMHRALSSTDCLVLATPAVTGAHSKGCACVACGAGRPSEAAEASGWQCSLCGTHNQAQLLQQQHLQDNWQQDLRDTATQEQTLLLGAGPRSSSEGAWQGRQQHGATPASRGSSSSRSGVGSSRFVRAGRRVQEVLALLASPPMLGCGLAVVVGLIRPLRDQLFAPEGSLLMVQDCIRMFGDCCIPCLLLMLGATLSKGPGQACPPLRVVASVAAARLVLLPLIGTGWLVLAKKLGLYAAPDKMFILVMLIQNAVPTALNVHTLATLHNNKEAEMGAMLFWQYLAACITLPAALSFFLWLLNTPVMSIQ